MMIGWLDGMVGRMVDGWLDGRMGWLIISGASGHLDISNQNRPFYFQNQLFLHCIPF
jgi:hypothetical protein